MHNCLGPGEQPNNPITVHMANGKDKISFGFSSLIEKNGRVSARFNTAARGHNWVKVEQIQPYEWKEVIPLHKQPGAKVRIQDGCSEWNGQIGTYVEFDEHASEGDFFGVRVDGDTVAFFRREDLEVIS